MFKKTAEREILQRVGAVGLFVDCEREILSAFPKRIKKSVY